MEHLSGRLRHHDCDELAVGDWVGLHQTRIDYIYTRSSVFVRKRAGNSSREQAIAGFVDSLSESCAGCDVLVVSAMTGVGIAELSGRLESGQTSVLVGSSGVGKSSLVNALLGEEVQEVREIREGDAKGQAHNDAQATPLPASKRISVDRYSRDALLRESEYNERRGSVGKQREARRKWKKLAASYRERTKHSPKS